MTTIIVTLQIEALHNWPEAKDKLPEMSFLSHPHRHIFHIECEKEVTHEDRDIEIIMFKNEIIDYFYRIKPVTSAGILDLGSMSCEMIAKDLVETYNLVQCRVLEDNENGARVTA